MAHFTLQYVKERILKASDFKVGDRVRDIDIEGNGTVTLVTENAVFVTFDDDNSSPFIFDEGVDLNYLAHGEG